MKKSTFVKKKKKKSDTARNAEARMKTELTRKNNGRRRVLRKKPDRSKREDGVHQQTPNIKHGNKAY